MYVCMYVCMYVQIKNCVVSKLRYLRLCKLHSQLYQYCIGTDAESGLNCDDFLMPHHEVRAVT